MVGSTLNYVNQNLPNSFSVTPIIIGLVLGIIFVGASCYFNRTKKETF